jgi:mRNA interferase HigB
MRITAKRALVDFWAKHPEAKDKLLAWYKILESCAAKNFTELKQVFPSADYVPEKYTIFDVGGNDYRIITVIHFNTQRVYIRLVATHTEYDRWSQKNRGK